MGEGDRPFGPYLLVDRIRKGGMAEVFRATRRGGDGTLVAIKRLLPQLADDPEVVAMFLNEARLVAVLRHPHIAQVFDLGRVGEDYFIAMEYVAGEDLRALAMRAELGRRLPLPLLALAAAQVCEALGFAHTKLDAAGASMGIIHRDVSPENVLVNFDGEAKLIDFGVAKMNAGPVKTQTGVLKGKFSYMSPEQVLAQPLDRRSDVFSMGVLLWEMATGRRLFLRDSDFATLRAVAHEPIPAPGDVNPDVPPGLERVILRALARDRKQRFQWASEMAGALRDYLATVAPRPTSAQLAAFMQESFPEEYARDVERRTGKRRPAPPPLPRPPGARPVIAPASMSIPEMIVPDLVTTSPELATRRARPPKAAPAPVEPELDIIPGQLIEVPAPAAAFAPEPPPTRRWKRRDVSIPVKGRWWLNARSPAALRGTVVTLSEGGAKLVSEEPVPANGIIELSIPIGFLRRVKVRGTVKWWHRNGQGREFGVEFEAPRRQLAG